MVEPSSICKEGLKSFWTISGPSVKHCPSRGMWSYTWLRLTVMLLRSCHDCLLLLCPLVYYFRCHLNYHSCLQLTARQQTTHFQLLTTPMSRRRCSFERINTLAGSWKVGRGSSSRCSTNTSTNSPHSRNLVAIVEYENITG